MDWIDTLDWSLVVQTLQFAATGYICGLVKKELEGPFHKLQNLEAADKLKERKKGKGTEDAVQELKKDFLELKNVVMDVMTQPEAPKAAKAPDAEKAPKAKKAEEATEAPKAEETKAEKAKKVKKAAAKKKKADAEKLKADEKAVKIAKLKADLAAAENS